LEATAPPRSRTEEWTVFLGGFPKWLPAPALAEPVYCLPKPAVAPLGNLAGFQAPAERAFTTLCEAHGAIGCWQAAPIRYPLLGHPPPFPDEGLTNAAGWTKAQRLQAKQASRKASDASLRLQGYVGWLLTEPTFLAAAAALASRWRALPAHERPSFPLRRLFRHPDATSIPIPSATAEQFAQDTRGFLDRWGLTEMITWDLPCPQGPLLPSLLPPGAPALPQLAIHIVLPLHYPLQNNDDLLRQILESQRHFARIEGLDESLAGLPHYKVYGAMLHVAHVEQTARSRLPRGTLPRGFVGRLEQALVAVLGGRIDQVRKLRKAIAKCRRGGRAGIGWLSPHSSRLQ
jgi:hypothetical protein